MGKIHFISMKIVLLTATLLCQCPFESTPSLSLASYQLLSEQTMGTSKQHGPRCVIGVSAFQAGVTWMVMFWTVAKVLDGRQSFGKPKSFCSFQIIFLVNIG